MAYRELKTWLTCLAAVLFCSTELAGAATYQLQVASIPERTFMYFVEGPSLPNIGAFLDDRPRSKRVMFRDRQPQLLELIPPNQSTPLPINVVRSMPNDPWSISTWEGEAGQLAVFRIRGKQSNYQKLRRVAVQTDGVPIRFPVRSVPASRQTRMQVPETAASYLVYLLDNGMIGSWTEGRAESYEGLSVIVGRHHDAQQSDTVYLVVRMRKTDQAYKVILGWETGRYEGAHGGDQRKPN